MKKVSDIQRPRAEMRAVSALRPATRNARKHSSRQIQQIARSIGAFGFNVPILVDAAGLVLAGHGRLMAAKQLGLIEIPVMVLDYLSPAQAKAFAIADNRLAETSTWDDALLAEILLELSAAELDFSIEDTGFTMGEIDFRIQGAAVSGEQADDEHFEPLCGPAVSRTGDLWILGEHRIVCGDALQASTYDVLMGQEKAGIVFADVPYNVAIDGNVSGKGRVRHREFAMASGEMSRPEFSSFLKSAFTHLAAHSVSGALHYICMDWRHLAETLEAGETAYTGLQNICVWVKDSGGMGSLYRSQHELVLVFRVGRDANVNNVQLGQFGRNRTNVWMYPSAASLSKKTGAENLLALHPTCKPIALVADALLDTSRRGDIVLDGFLGSGTTLLAAQRVGRRCRGIEIEPGYVDTAILRWEKATGATALHSSGLSFAQLKEGRGARVRVRAVLND
jgi:hypothetical protein